MHSTIKGIREEDSVNRILIVPLGERALLIDWGGGIARQTHEQIRFFCSRLERADVSGVLECIPSYTTVTVIYDPMELRDPETGAPCYQRDGLLVYSPFELLKGIVEGILCSLDLSVETTAANIVDIPVCYGGEFGPDLQEVAEHTGLHVEEVIELHCSPSYLVYMVGFAPGFPYLGGMDERLAVPRRSSPRTAITPGSVGIGGSQTGVYPLATPGGWRLIGRTPRKLFRPDHPEPSLLKMGDIVRFYPIEPEQFAEWKEDEQ
ncbi:5-oxoprolinase subunit PxpB [Paenibacillus sp. SC116]|uniref:5-oxoprolinase subunit PxpB n=1 Tax=Paenibacillus sp. SC116 TaxID=2968986 RepID=UPI00215A7365|nr:5-oxoprolinase subunit PxpB [Paenibacillus sp. SC116]MCR8846391.1 5-oxoprolinase subunit PxpB [Paenibacillus sp. SC116]